MHRKIRTGFFCLLIGIWALLAVWLWFGPRADYTVAERRKLAQMPELSAKTVFSGDFMPKFEDFTLDQFPLRDNFRQVKSLFHYYALQQKDNNGIYLVGDTVAKIEYPMSTVSVNYATGRFQYVYEKYLENTQCNIYSTMIPDKGCFLAEANGYPAMDYAALADDYQAAMPWAEYVDITGYLDGEDYYRTDTHWRQEKILDVAEALCLAMDTRKPAQEDYTRTVLDVPFYGVYFGQAALPMAPEEMVILESELLKGCSITDPATGKTTEVYNLQKLTSPDLYDVFLSGAQPILTVDNPGGEDGRELVIFRDSFGSSLTPLLLQGYSRVTLVDTRYIHPDQVGQFVEFTNQDVLFAYSSLILNSGRSLK